jgi:hypothetical protein
MREAATMAPAKIVHGTVEIERAPYAGPERRRHRRYIVRGRVRFAIDSLEVWADLVNFGAGGMQIRSRYELPAGSRRTFRLMAFCYPVAIDVEGEVVGGREELVSIQFVNKPDTVNGLLRWLEQEHFPWTGPANGTRLDGLRDRTENDFREAEDALELVYQDA